MSQTLRRSLSLAGLICVLVASSRVTTVSGHSINCPIPRDFTVVVDDKQRTIISKARLKVYLDEDAVLITSREATNSFVISADRVTLKFTGLMKTEFGVEGQADGLFATNEQEVSERYHDRLSGVARKAMPDSTLLAVSDNCRFAFLPTAGSVSSPRSEYRLAREVRRLAEMCVQREVCPIILQIGSQSVTRWLSDKPAGQSLPVNGNLENDKGHSCRTMQDAINMMVDIGIGQLAQYLATGENHGTVALPDVTTQFPSGSISLVRGTFSDIRTLKRYSNVGISRNGTKLTLAIQIYLDKLVIGYEHYSLRSLVNTIGHLTGSIAGTLIAAQVSANYEQQRCAITVDSLEVIYLGRIKFKLSGLGRVLDSLVGSITKLLTHEFHDSVKSALQRILRQNVQDLLSTIDCGTYRA